VDWSAIAFAVALSLVSGLLSGLAPALQLSSTNVSASLREEGRGTSGTRSRNLSRNVLVAGQIALSLILLVGAGLLIRSFILLESQSPGFNPEDVLKMNVALPPSKYSRPDQMIAFFDDLVQRVAALPGVKAAAISSALPANVARLTPMLVEGQAAVPLPERPIIIVQTFTSSYLRVLQVPLIKGRFFNTHDDRDSLPVIVINQSFAKKFFLGQNPIGKRVWIGRRTAPAQIVGVIGDIKNVSLSTDAQPEVDLPFAQLPWARMNLIVHTIGHPKIFTGAVRVQIAKLDRSLPVTDVETIGELLADESARPRMLMNLLAGLAVFAFVLSIVGLYGAINYSVAQRTQEMGVRIALGATRRDLLKLVLGYGTSVACVGIGIGIACSLVLTDAMKKLVYAISTKDPITFLVVPAAFLICALIASYFPARRALRVNVMDALRE
jgi:predicted permease